jgi:lipid-A-disaccharide synthase
LHGSNLIRELRKRCPDLQAVGYGGPKMAAAGCELHEDMTRLAVMAIWLALRHLHQFLGLLWRADRYFRDHRPDAVVMIDFPGFNWWIARRAKARGIPVIYYGTPQLWAWASWRVRKMRRFVDHVICKLPFEVPWYAERGVTARFVGHPYFDQLAAQTLDSAFLDEQRRAGGRMVAILPGSRTQEVLGTLPSFLRVAALVQRELPETRFAIASYSPRHDALARKILAAMPESERPRLEFHVERTQELMSSAVCCVACSGSVSLELMHHAKPTVIYYRVNRRGYLLQHVLRKCNFITLVNLLAVAEPFRRGWASVYDPDAANAIDVPFPEYLASADKAPEIAAWIRRWLDDPQELRRREAWLIQLRDRFGHPGASVAAADYILSVLRDDGGERRAA